METESANRVIENLENSCYFRCYWHLFSYDFSEWHRFRHRHNYRRDLRVWHWLRGFFNVWHNLSRHRCFGGFLNYVGCFNVIIHSLFGHKAHTANRTSKLHIWHKHPVHYMDYTIVGYNVCAYNVCVIVDNRVHVKMPPTFAVNLNFLTLKSFSGFHLSYFVNRKLSRNNMVHQNRLKLWNILQ